MMPQSARESKHPEDEHDGAPGEKVCADTLITLMSHCGAIRRQVVPMATLAPLTQTPAIEAAIDDLVSDLNGLRNLVRERLEQLRTDRAIVADSLEDPAGPVGRLRSIEVMQHRQELREAIAMCSCQVQPSFRHGCGQCNGLRDRLAASYA